MSERDFAIREAEEIGSSDDFFKARADLESDANRRVFRAGFDRAWQKRQSAIDQLTAEIAEYRRILDGIPQDAIDGGWTAKGLSQYAKGLEGEVERLKAEMKDMVHL